MIWEVKCPACGDTVHVEDEDYPTNTSCPGCETELGIEWCVDIHVYLKEKKD